MQPKPRGLMVIHHFRPGPTGGAELQAERLAAALVRLGHPIQVLTWRTVADAPIDEQYQGVHIHRMEQQLPYYVLHGGVDTFRYLVQHRSMYDILHCHMAYAHAMVAVIVARCFQKKCIIKIACAGEFGELSNFSTFAGFEYALDILRLADRFIAVSQEVRNELIGYGFPADKIILIPNGVDTDLFQPASRSLPDEARPFRFIQIGRLHPQKGVDVSLQAVKILRERGLSGQFVLDFYGATLPEYDFPSLALDLGVQDSVTFYSFISDIGAVYRTADALILPSRGEGLSNTLLEAMSSGLAVIASRVSGTQDVVDDSLDGILIPPDSPVSLADQMERVMTNPELALKLGRHARQKIEASFSLDVIARRYSQLYDSMGKL